MLEYWHQFDNSSASHSGNSHHFQTHQLFRMNLRGLGAELAADLVVAVAGSFDVRQQLGWLLEFLQRINDVKLCSYCFFAQSMHIMFVLPKAAQLSIHFFVEENQ